VLCTSGDGNHRPALRAHVPGCVWEVASSASLRVGAAKPRLGRNGFHKFFDITQAARLAALLNCSRRSSAPSVAQVSSCEMRSISHD